MEPWVGVWVNFILGWWQHRGLREVREDFQAASEFDTTVGEWGLSRGGGNCQGGMKIDMKSWISGGGTVSVNFPVKDRKMTLGMR